MTSEYSALRASVLKVWAGAADREINDRRVAINDITRFNEAIDQALVESVAFYAQQVEREQNVFLAIVGHDLRNPLDTINSTAQLLTRLHPEGLVAQAATRLTRSGNRMKHLLDDLLDYNRAILSAGLQIAPADCDLGEVCAIEVESFQNAHSDKTIALELSGDLRGRWDATRIQQLLANLLRNALDCGVVDEPVQVKIKGTADVILSVQNRGLPIPASTMAHIFEPLKRGGQDGAPKSGTHLGLGLSIAREIAKAHGGDIQVASANFETTFFVRLPRG